VIGHYARDCEKRKGVEKTLITAAKDEEETQEETDELDIALVASSERAMFASHKVMLGTESSINILKSRKLLSCVREANKKVVLGGIQRGASGVRVTQQGIFRANRMELKRERERVAIDLCLPCSH
jgi:hypothetical protein